MTVWGVLRSFLAIGLVTALGVGAAHAQSGNAANFPNRPVKIVVPFPAGGPTDVNMRIIGQKLSELWNQGVVIENRPGANTGIGAQFVAKSAPDGYTLLAAMDTTLVMNPATGASMNYDPFKDFTAITLTAKNTSLLTVRASDGPKTVKELIARGKASGAKLNYGAGITITRLAGAVFAKAAGIDAVLIPYKGSAEVVQGLLTGSVDFIVDGVAPSLPPIAGGQFRPLAKLNSRPLPVLPDVPSLSEASGLPIDEMSSWIGLVAPAGTPQTIVHRIQQDVVKAIADPTVAERLEKAGILSASTTPEEFEQYFRSEAKRWTTVYKESGIKLD
ncbi:Bug family tripartite tricarboxylate transporter substrate binding protein [Rhodoplanes sp. Z2-YC6860]|uniref:Bug family tripartite tricarboxylate transporter substrate binding protein n=1 Tax=Rhodoplanes sp. Z2-YC6860 TaxID=674703 RepID=UPI00078E455A|nr:tripartite tricarboxylate transporter substrate binding protein [Rhodoplanes sp. Z2-YC6860]AMN43546.1 extra-cytoplasmic solute receptor [Rhodoplanes sp. Z2-YC6860]